MSILTVRTKNGTSALPFTGTPIAADLLRAAGYSFRADCGGRGACGKCALLLTGTLSAPEEKEKELLPFRLACRTRLLGDAEAILPGEEITVFSVSSSSNAHGCRPEGGYGIALDLGTTTLAARLYDLGTGALLSSGACPNPQSVFGADVTSRIAAAAGGNLPLLTALVRKAILSLSDSLCRRGGIDRSLLTRGVAVGNTTMLYLLCGYDPEALGHSPFGPLADFSDGIEIGGIRFTLPAPIDAFVGSDTVSAILSCGLRGEKRTTLLCDIGTNGEIVLSRGGMLYASSCAAGPAFEGAGISCGCPAMPGAIFRVREDPEGIRFDTVGGIPERGICGSGLLDAAAVFLGNGSIDGTGRVLSPLRIGSLTLTAEDVRALQLAKAAIAGGIRTLCEIAGASPKEIGKILIAGGFGSGLDPVSAVRVGLFPPSLPGVTESVGNAALNGCAMILLSPEAEESARRTALEAIPCPLGGSGAFEKHFIDNLPFENPIA